MNSMASNSTGKALRKAKTDIPATTTGDASVLFPFECKALVFDDDVFTLENKMHKYFNDKRVNKENLHKEFFYGDPIEPINVLKNVFKCDIHYIDKNEINEEEENDD